MEKPTKFSLMRWNRSRAGFRALAVVPLVDKFDPAPAPAVPTMEVDGVPYREAPEVATCGGCAFAGCSASCHQAMRGGIEAFGAGCGERGVIYIRA